MQHLLKQTPFGLRRVSILTAIFIGVMALATVSGFTEDLELRFDRPAGFSIRELLGKSPALTDKLVIIGMDDISVASQQLTELNLRSWSYILNGISAAKPRVVIVDKIFNSPLRPQQPEDFVQAVRHLPVVVGAVASEAKIEGRPQLNLERKEFLASTYFDGGNVPALFAKTLAEKERYPYGPNPNFIDAFSRLGHIQLDDHGTIRAFEFVTRDRLVPHVAFHAASVVEANEKGLFIDGRHVSLDRQGRFPVNLISPDTLVRHVVRMDKAIDALATSKPIPGLDEGDTVLILPNLYTGGGDIKQTPLGKMPGGYLQASVLNSVLTGAWIQQIRAWQLLLVLAFAACTTAFVAYKFSALATAIASTALAATAGVSGVALFVYAGMSSPWIFASGSIAVFGAVLAFEKARRMAMRADALTDALGGKISSKEISEMVRTHEFIDVKPSVQTLTIMFIDLVGFSKLAENIPAEELFMQLKTKLSAIRGIIHEHGGYIDRTLGDGLLCYFGFRYLGLGDQGENHADRALRCASALQLQNLRSNIAGMEANQIIYPMRIGINTAQVCVGDLGDDNRLDFTAIGNGVNFTKRLESACGFYRVMMSAETMATLSPELTSMHKTNLHPRLVQIKHHADLKPACEFDPIPSSAEDAITVMRYFWASIGLKRNQGRLSLPALGSIKATGEHINGHVCNFSENGVALRIDQYIADGAEVSFQLNDQTGDLHRKLAERDLLPLKAEIRWGMPQEGQYLHGLSLKGLTPAGTKFLFDCLSEYLEPKSPPKAV